MELNLKLAWKRYKKDLKDEQSFSDHPFEVNIIDNNLDDWLEKLSFTINEFSPSNAYITNIPKKDHHIRPGTILTSVDSTIYNALILHEVDKIRDKLLWSAGKFRYSNILTKNQSSNTWFTYNSWKYFINGSKKLLSQDFNWVLFTDISGFFENISIPILLSDLRDFSLDTEIIELLGKCLKKWAGQAKSRGIPQGSRVSFLLAEIYLNSIDLALTNHGVQYCRFVDDFRIFTRTKEDAIDTLHFLTKLLRSKELNLQTSKSFIKKKEDAVSIIDNTFLIDELEEEIKNEFLEELDITLGYTSPKDIKKMLDENKINIQLNSIRKAVDQINKDLNSNFNKSFFHFCINRLAVVNDNYAIDLCFNILTEKPEEFNNILKYFSSLEDDKITVAEKVSIYILDETNFNSYIKDRIIYLFLKWIYNEEIINDSLIRFCRTVSFESDLEFYVKHYAWAILAKYGNTADLDLFLEHYSNLSTILDKATIICCLKQVEIRKRNNFYSRCIGDGNLVGYAIIKCKST